MFSASYYPRSFTILVIVAMGVLIVPLASGLINAVHVLQGVVDAQRQFTATSLAVTRDVRQVAEGKGNYGYNAGNGSYGDMMEMGVLDPTKVTRTALQNAASIAGLMITTEAMVADLPKKDEPAMPAGGGMGGMDMM